MKPAYDPGHPITHYIADTLIILPHDSNPSLTYNVFYNVFYIEDPCIQHLLGMSVGGPKILRQHCLIFLLR